MGTTKIRENLKSQIRKLKYKKKVIITREELIKHKIQQAIDQKSYKMNLDETRLTKRLGLISEG